MRLPPHRLRPRRNKFSHRQGYLSPAGYDAILTIRSMKLAVTILVFCVAGLLALGMVMLYSSSMAQVGARYLLMQLVWCGLGLVACGTALAIDYRILKKLAWPLFGFSLVLL